MSRDSIHLHCPVCDHVWLGGILDRNTWWGKGVNPQRIADVWYYPECQPETLVKAELELQKERTI